LCYSLKAQLVIDAQFKHKRFTKEISYEIDSLQIWEQKGLFQTRALDFTNKSKPYLKHQNNFPLILKIEVTNTNKHSVSCILDFNNAELNKFQVVQLNDKQEVIYTSPILGDLQIFASRIIQYRVPAVPITLMAESKSTLLIGIANKNRMITGYIDIDRSADWHTKTRKLSYYHGWLSGLYGGFFMLGLILFLIIRQKIFLFYSMYVFGVAILLLTIWGYPFQYLFPNNIWLQDKFLLFIQLMGLLFLNLYALSLFQLEGLISGFKKIQFFIVTLYAIMILLVFSEFGKLIDGEDFLSNVLFIVEVLNFFLLVVSGPAIYLWKRRLSAFVFFISFVPVGLSLFYSTLSFLIPQLPYILLMDSLSVTLFLEILILSIFMIYEFKKSLIKKIELERALFLASKENQLAFMRGQEDEKKKIAMELHDGVATDLVLLKQWMETSENSSVVKAAKTKIDYLTIQIRNLSHQLLPWNFQHNDLNEAISNLFLSMPQEIQVKMNLEKPPSWLDSYQQTQLFRIVQELVKNTLKHARAKSIFLQLIDFESYIELHYEDDGVGFDANHKGVGLKSISSRAEMANGTISIETNKNSGTLVIVKFHKLSTH
jgi:signal transduction histidine kinase